MENQYKQFRQKFIDEATRLTDDLERDLLKLENRPENNDLIESVFRCMHTLKGVSSMYGFDNIANVTHHLENIYDLIREKTLTVDSALIQITLVAADFIRSLLSENDQVSEANQEIQQKIMASIQQIIDSAGVDKPKKIKQKLAIKDPDNLFATWQITFYPEESIITRCVNLVYTFQDLFNLGNYQIIQNEPHEDQNKFTIFLFTDKGYDAIEDALLFIMDYCKITKIADFDIFDIEELEKHSFISDEPSLSEDIIKPKVKEKYISPQSIMSIAENDEAKPTAMTKSRISVEASKLDELMYLVSELITTNSQLNLASKNAAYVLLTPLFEKIDKLSKQFRHSTLNLRLVPLNEMAVRFQRLVRDLSGKLGKEVELQTQGTETELDKNTIDALVDPLMHIIRNCIDHGIESPEKREERNKLRKGIVKISAYHSGSFIFIRIQDDGKGIDTEFIRNKAIEKGIVSPDKHLTKKEIFDLIFIPGFSTAESLTQVSGRGVGMDVVKRKITELRGQVEIDSEKGLGTSFTIKLHQSIAILDTMLFQIGDMFFLVPLADVDECRLMNRTEIEKRQNTQTIPHNGRLIPFIDLHELFALKSETFSDKQKLLVIKRQDACFAIAADRIIGEHQAVLKSLGEVAKKQDFISVASMLGDGNLAYLLDLNAIQNSFTI